MSLTIEGGAAPALEPAETVTQPVKSENSAPESTVKQENNNSTLAKAGELQFSGAYMAARVDRQQPVPVTTPQHHGNSRRHSGNLSGRATGEAKYTPR